MSFKLAVPLQLADLAQFKAGDKVKVILADQQKALQSTIVALNEKGAGSANFTGESAPAGARILVGPPTATDDEMLGLQTLIVNLSPAQFLKPLDPISISDQFWRWWLTWCRTFTITGRVLCPNGTPVPYAQVCAYDVDFFWWWFTEEQVGCATTDANGFFKIEFTWCCGFFWWWWLARRRWQLSTEVAEDLINALRGDKTLKTLPLPTPTPNLGIFSQLVAPARAGASVRAASAVAITPDTIASLEPALKTALASVSAAQRLRLWPWYPWAPWTDCTPDIYFRVTQTCNNQLQTIVNEGFANVRYDIPTTLNVPLTASSNACCVPVQRQPPPGDCVVLSSVCGDTPGDIISAIGGNVDAQATPAGLLDPYPLLPPHSASINNDRPYAGSISIYGVFGNTAPADYYEFEYAYEGGAFLSMPPASVAVLQAWYFGPSLGGGPGLGPHPVTITQTINGRLVTVTRPHFEATNGAGTWGVTRFWTSDWGLLMSWETSVPLFANGTYALRVRTWTAANLLASNPADLTKSTLLPTCDTKATNNLVITLDNQLAGPAFHPADHPCGPGTVHICTTQPDTYFIGVQFMRGGVGIPLPPCSDDPQNNQLQPGDTLEIDFYAHDPDGFLAYFDLYATFGNSLSTPVLGAPGAVLTAGAPYLAIPPASQVGPDYGLAITQGAASPVWNGGTLRLTVPAANVFKTTCCYQLVLQAYKRTIVDCDHSFDGQSNLSEYSFLVIV
jgi:hypothetical protein